VKTKKAKRKKNVNERKIEKKESGIFLSMQMKICYKSTLSSC